MIRATLFAAGIGVAILYAVPASANEITTILNLVGALHNTPARVYYGNRCTSSEMSPNEVPDVILEPAETPRPLENLQWLRNALSPQGALVGQRPSGIVTVQVGSVPRAVLETTIAVVRFIPTQQYDPHQAIFAIDNAPEVKRAMAAAKLQFARAYADYLTAPMPPNPRAPHLPPVIRNLTLDQALDAVASTFTGIVLYGVCTRRHDGGSVWIQFIDNGAP